MRLFGAVLCGGVLWAAGAAAQAGVSAWAGSWADGQNSIEIREEKGGLHVSGEALWLGAKHPDGTQAVNTGTLEFTAAPSGGKLVLQPQSDGDCGAELTLKEERLFVHDNGRCGGLNVSFSGVYARR